jgi:crotonobetainyl-CoA:carnitine CoA-transferase CaiB-like acyl-CoA transferase
VAGILKDLRVLDFTRIAAGPFTTRMLADFGAEVIKIQSSKMEGGLESNTAPYFCAWNRNKRSITLDMGYSEARELFLQLSKISDVVVENFSPRVMPNWDLDYRKLQSANKKLIMLSMSGMGHTGPLKDHVAFGPTVQALGGLTHLTAYSSEDPMGVGYAYADMISGLYGAIAVLAALGYRDRTGQGQFIDLSEYEAVCTTLGPSLMDAFINMREIGPVGNVDIHRHAGPHGCYKCLGSDRWCVIAVYSDDEWQALCRVIGDPAIKEDYRFSSAQNRQEHRQALDSLIGNWTKRQTAEKVVKRLQQVGIAAGVVQNAEDLAADPQLVANDFFTTLDHPVLGRITTDTTPVKLRNNPRGSWKASPLLGEANYYVFGELLGMTETEIRSYIQKGIIA